jgi:hypothetical protein
MLPNPDPKVIFKELAEGGVLFHTVHEVYYGLNEVGRQVWSRLPPHCETMEDLCAEVHGLYPSVPLDTIVADVQELLDDLVGFGLLSPAKVAVEQGAAAVSPR